ncbi:hypothetical protein [Labrys neptuniae]
MSMPLGIVTVLLRGLALWFAMTVPVLAEVCDKVVGDAWSPDDGPALFRYSWTAVVLVCVVGAWFSRQPWLSFLVASTATAMMLFSLLGALTDEPVYSFAVGEGCISRELDIIDMLLNAGSALGCVLLGFWQRRSRAMIRT